MGTAAMILLGVLGMMSYGLVLLALTMWSLAQPAWAARRREARIVRDLRRQLRRG